MRKDFTSFNHLKQRRYKSPKQKRMARSVNRDHTSLPNIEQVSILESSKAHEEPVDEEQNTITSNTHQIIDGKLFPKENR